MQQSSKHSFCVFPKFLLLLFCYHSSHTYLNRSSNHNHDRVDLSIRHPPHVLDYHLHILSKFYQLWFLAVKTHDRNANNCLFHLTRRNRTFYHPNRTNQGGYQSIHQVHQRFHWEMGLDALRPTSMGRQTSTWKDWLMAQEWAANWETLIEFV